MILEKGSNGEDVKILQNKLNTLGMDAGEVDGIFGDKTDKAVKELQYIFSLAADGIVGTQTFLLFDKLNQIKNFKLDEFRCRHCKKLKLNINLLLKLEDLRKAIGDKPMIINSGYRCPIHNKAVGGIKNSEHLKGNAADIRVNSLTPNHIYKIADKMFNGVGLYNTFTHVDVGVNKYRWDKSTKVVENNIVHEPKTIKKFDSFIYYLETDKNMFVDADLGVRFKKERVSEIVKNTPGTIAGINAGFFSKAKDSEHNTLYISKGLFHNPPSPITMDFIYYKDGTTEIRNIKEYNQAELSGLQQEAYWAIGTSYSLVQKGKFNLENFGNFSHAKNKEPRTMIGQKENGNFIIAVADGRSKISKGLNAQEQAEVMLELGCYNAVNLDGGGSSTFVFVRNGKAIVYNNPSDGVERAVGSVILVKMA